MTETRLTAEDRALLRAIAEQATPGPWKRFRGADAEVHAEVRSSPIAWTLWDRPQDAAHIAAFHPETALALLDQVDALERERDEAHAKIAAVEARCAALEARETRVRDVLTQLETYRRQPIRTFNPLDEVEVLRQERIENVFMDAWLPRLRAALAADDAPATPPGEETPRCQK